MINEIEKNIIKSIFEDMKNGKYPKFGSPETTCDKCMFANIACKTSLNFVGCLGGWKREKE